MSGNLTRCPQCQSPFRVLPVQLEAAQGLVRCGTCLTAFNAREHAVGDWPTAEITEQPGDDITATLADIDDELLAGEESLIDEVLASEAIPQQISQAASHETDEPSLQPPTLPPVLESVELETAHRKPFNFGRWLASMLIVAVAGALIIAQYAWFYSDRLSLNQRYRPYLEPFCAKFNCPLSELRDLRLIHTSNLLVRSHPEHNNAISVDLLMRNTAPYEQRFPALILVFSDINGKLVAQRKLQPAEYLLGELKGARSMPPNQQVHINIELLDPGTEAINYQVRLSD